MMNMEFVRDVDGKYRRVWIGRDLVEKDQILGVQQKLARKNPGMDIVRESRLHLTQYHFGRPEWLLADIKKINPELKEIDFFKEFKNTLTKIDLPKKEIESEIEELEIFKQGTLNLAVLILKKNQQLIEGRDEFLTLTANFLEKCGVLDIKGFIKTNLSFRYQTSQKYNPHITIGRLNGDVNLPKLRLEELRLRLSEARLFNIKFD